MVTIFIILGIAFLIGLILRDKGEGFLDTLQTGCSTIGCLIVIVT